MDRRPVAAVTRTSAGNRRTGAAESLATGASRGARIPGGIPGGEVVEITKAAGPLLPGLVSAHPNKVLQKRNALGMEKKKTSFVLVVCAALWEGALNHGA